MITKLLLALAVVLLVALIWRPGLGFRAQSPRDYAGTTPAFDLAQHLSGPMLAEGVIYGPTGRVISRFVAQMEGMWDGPNGTLAEQFQYASGTTQVREWRLQLGENGAFTGAADDIIGQMRGQISGAAVQLQYRLRLPPSGGGHVVDVTDWMYLMDNGTIMNRAQMRKFGVKVAEMVATFRPAP